jgi:hypothetical protein
MPVSPARRIIASQARAPSGAADFREPSRMVRFGVRPGPLGEGRPNQGRGAATFVVEAGLGCHGDGTRA